MCALAGTSRSGRQTLEQRVARKVQADARAALTQRKQQVNIGVGGIDVGATARGLGQTVAQRVFGAQAEKRVLRSCSVTPRAVMAMVAPGRMMVSQAMS